MKIHFAMESTIHHFFTFGKNNNRTTRWLYNHHNYYFIYFCNTSYQNLKSLSDDLDSSQQSNAS